MELYPCQEIPLREALRRGADGKFVYSTAVWSAIKKSAKSSIAAAVGLWFAFRRPWSSVKVIANDLKQADSRVAYYMRRAILLHPEWSKTVKVSGYKITLPNHSVIEAIPIDPKGEAGGNDDLVIYSEIWGWKEKASLAMWSETTLSPMKFGQSMRFCETYAGFVGESPILEQLYEDGVTNGRVLDAEYEMYANGRLFVLWMRKPHLPWQTSDYYCLPLPEKKNELMALTYKGWKPAEEIVISDRLCTRNDRGEIEYQYPSSIFRDKYSGELLRLKNSKANLVMTPNHRVFGAFASHTRKVKGILENGLQFEYREAEEARKAQVGWIPGIAGWNYSDLDHVDVENETYLGDDFIEFLAWYLSEGNSCVDNRNRKPYYSMLEISQGRDINPEKCKEIRNLLDRMGVGYTQTKSGFRIFNSRLARYVVQFGKSHEKSIPRFVLETCSVRQLKLFFDTYAKGDGTKLHFGDGIAIYTNSDQMALDLLELGLKAGYRPKRIGSYSSAPEKGRKPIHHLHFLKSHIGWSCISYKRRRWAYEQAPENCEVWCPTVPNGNFYVMQNGTCYWSGNSQEAATLMPNEFDRIHRNQWVSSTGSFVQPEWWDACKGVVPAPEVNEQLVVALDASVSGDCFGILAATRRDGKTIPRFIRKWTPPSGGKIQYTPPPGVDIMDTNYPSGFIRWLVETQNVLEVAYDPYQLHSLASALAQELVTYFREFNQASDRLVADKSLQDAIKAKEILHDGNDDLTEHVVNAAAKVEGEKIRIVKKTESKKIDLCVCLSMAHAEVVRLGI
jgi:hypothetical protein